MECLHNFSDNQLIEVVKNNDSALNFLKAVGLIVITRNCEFCGNPCVLRHYHKYESFHCLVCKRSSSILKYTILERNKISPITLVKLLFHWAYKTYNFKNTIRLLKISGKTASNYRKLFQRISIRQFFKKNIKIGGNDHVVEINEMVYSKLKPPIGRIRKLNWIIGGIDLTTKEAFLAPLKNRIKEELEDTLQDIFIAFH